jgi:hypothetical protein
MSAGRYRTVFHSPLAPAQAYAAAQDEMRALAGTGADLLHNSANSADGARTWRWQLREAGEDGARLSSLSVHAPAEPDQSARTWFWAEVEQAADGAPAEAEPAARADVPPLARRLLAKVPAYDSIALLTCEPMVVGRDGVDALIDVLCDPERRLPVIVASAHPVVSFEEWRGVIRRVTGRLPGLASLYLLDAPGTGAFGRGIGRSHAVWGGALRTYLPDVDPAVPTEALRHRVLTAARIQADPGRAAGIVSVLPWRLGAEAPLPAPLAGVNRALLTQTAESVLPSGEATVRSQVAGLVEERELALRLAEEQEGRANAFFAQRENALAELVEREQRVLDLEALVRTLRRRLVDSGRPEDAYRPADEPVIPPETFGDLVDWMEAGLPLVRFTGDRNRMLSLDRSPESSTWVRSSWEVLRALQAYADAKAARAFAGDFKMWCDHPPSGTYAVPAGKVVRDESETVRTNARWRREREFPVPPEIDVTRSLFMGAHIRIGASASGRINPRLYFHDATAQTGHVYVGYLGRHLTNTRT